MNKENCNNNLFGISRLNSFLTNYNFYPNNVEFRIKSSKALEKWKNVQSFQLNQLINGKFYFDKNCREIILLQYDLWTRFLIELENYCIESLNKNNYLIVQESIINYIIKLADKTISKFRSIVIEEYPERFNTKFIKILLECRQYPLKYLKSMIYSFKGLNFMCLFINLVDTLVDVMQHSLIEMHELNSFFNHKDTTPFVVVSDFSRKALSILNINFLSDNFLTIGIIELTKSL